MILLEKERISAQELAKMFEVSTRTIYRDIDAINQAGIPVLSTSGNGGGIEIMSQYKVDKKIFSTDDLSALLMGLTNLSGMVRGSEVANAIAKVKSFIPSEKAKSVELKASQIYIDLTPWEGNGNVKTAIEIIKNALQENKLITFTYIDGHGTKTTRTVEPYQLVFKGRAWYVQTFCRLKNDYRLFRLSRMSNLNIIEETFTPREYQKPFLDFEETAKSFQIHIKIRIHSSVLDRILDFCPFDRITAAGGEYYLVDYPFVDSDYYYDMLLSLGDKCEVIEPDHVRKKLKQKIQNLINMYADS